MRNTSRTPHIKFITKMGRTFALVFWIQIFAVITHSEGGIPLSLRCTSRPALSTFSRSSGSPFLAAEPYLTFSPTDLPQLILDKDAEETPQSLEISPKTIVILHKVHKNDDSDIEIIITTRDTKENKENSSESNESSEDIDQSIENQENDKSLTETEPITSEEITKDDNSEPDKNDTTTEIVHTDKTIEVERNYEEDNSFVDNN